VAEAKERFSKLLHDAEGEPQEILNRDRLVAVVIGAESFAALDASRPQPSIGAVFQELRKIVSEEGYRLKIPRRGNRPNTFARALSRPAR
jgi:antitoxin (DNA-binding transcriptional repressor) of toxin-antitoxin stability system